MKCFDKAENISPKNIKNRYDKAECLISLGRDHEALKYLEVLKKELPDESKICRKIGELHKRLGNKQEAHNAFNEALSLNPRE